MFLKRQAYKTKLLTYAHNLIILKASNLPDACGHLCVPLDERQHVRAGEERFNSTGRRQGGSSRRKSSSASCRIHNTHSLQQVEAEGRTFSRRTRNLMHIGIQKESINPIYHSSWFAALGNNCMSRIGETWVNVGGATSVVVHVEYLYTWAEREAEDRAGVLARQSPNTQQT